MTNYKVFNKNTFIFKDTDYSKYLTMKMQDVRRIARVFGVNIADSLLKWKARQ